ncbi:hypothetical protein [Streptomyces sp. JV178]|uniref:hypothetical protein n=1 Tax=Streptomyces sp. JV178 TaxID=858632 RepID=UPI0015D53E74|nr:hypothetical protein [Streptomyces sp. JV178]
MDRDGRGGLQAVGLGEDGGVGAVGADEVDVVVVAGGRRVSPWPVKAKSSM